VVDVVVVALVELAELVVVATEVEVVVATDVLVATEVTVATEVDVATDVTVTLCTVSDEVGVVIVSLVLVAIIVVGVLEAVEFTFWSIEMALKGVAWLAESLRPAAITRAGPGPRTDRKATESRMSNVRACERFNLSHGSDFYPSKRTLTFYTLLPQLR